MIKTVWHSVRASAAARAARRRRASRLRPLEALEPRTLLSAAPFGAAPQDTGEFMLGSVLVTPVFLESTGALDTSTEDWTPGLIEQVKTTLTQGVEWWEETLANYTAIHSLDFIFDYQYADQPVPTKYEPISRVSNDYSLWVDEFLTTVGYNSALGIDADIRAFNHAQREAHGTDWAFTIFVVNSFEDPDGQFKSGGSFTRAFAFAGGRYIVSPATRPESTFAHETGHMFWARDEYFGGGSWTDRRGYYNTQNVNAADNPTTGFVQQDSIMASSARMTAAFDTHTSAPSTLEMIGWRDADGDGVFDVLDVPHTLTGVGWYDADAEQFRFEGYAEVGTLPNRNSSGLQNDITINEITRVEYRIDGGTWLQAAAYGTAAAEIEIAIDVPAGEHQIDIRTVTVDPGTSQLVTSSPVFSSSMRSAATATRQGLAGFVYNDDDGDGEWDAGETGISGTEVRLLDAAGQPLTLEKRLDPDDYADAQVLNQAVAGVTLTATGSTVANNQVLSGTSNPAPTGTQVFAYTSTTGSTRLSWFEGSSELRIDFASPQTYVALDAVAHSTGGVGRLEAYDAAGNLLARDNSESLSGSTVATLEIVRAQPDIAYVKAFGRTGAVRLDNLRVGTPVTVTTTTHGAYEFAWLPSGSYTVEVVTSDNQSIVQPASGQYVVDVANDSTTAGLHFGLESNYPWRNPANPADVNNDGRVTVRDVILLLNRLLTSGAAALPPPTLANSPPDFVDVSGDGRLDVSDVRQVLSSLLQQSGSGEPVQAGSGEPPPISADADKEGEGEANGVLDGAAPVASVGNAAASLLGRSPLVRKNVVHDVPPRVVHDVALTELMSQLDAVTLRAAANHRLRVPRTPADPRHVLMAHEHARSGGTKRAELATPALTAADAARLIQQATAERRAVPAGHGVPAAPRGPLSIASATKPTEKAGVTDDARPHLPEELQEGSAE